MSKFYFLNRISITGKLNETTPSCVVLEIAQAHNLVTSLKISKFEENWSLIQDIQKYRTDKFEEPLNSSNLRYMAFYINRDSASWKKSSIVEAYNHMHNFDRNDLSKISYGQKTHENLYVYNNCMLYSLCKHHRIDTTWDMTAEQMLLSLNRLNLQISNLQTQVLSLIYKANKSTLINLLNSNMTLDFTEEIKMLTPEKELPPISNLEFDELKSSLTKFQDTRHLLKQIRPKTHSDAVILGALIYNLNLTESTIPHSEYLRLQEVSTVELYTPIDETFKNRYLKNPTWYDLSINWEPKLSFIYDDSGLRKLCTHEGFEVEDYRNFGYESLLQISRISTNVYFGKSVYSDDEYTPINLDLINELHHSECLHLGNMESRKLITYTINELAMHFEQGKEFTNPENPSELLENRIVNKIRLYALNLNHSRMLEVIESVNMWKSFSNVFTDKLRTCYSENSNIVDIFYEILNTGMYMRGWKVVSETYPMDSESTVNEENKLPEIEQNVSDAINRVFEKLKTYSESEQEILQSLPLMKVAIHKGVKSFIMTPDEDDGKSMFHRLEIVLNGNVHKNTKSCIRLSSNILLISIYYYLVSLGINEPFDLSNLDYIT